MPEENLPVVLYKTELAATFADLLSIAQDLQRVECICERLSRELSAEPGDCELVDVLWTAALVRYGRCFKKGKRKPLTIDVLSHLRGNPIAAHTYYLNQRDKLVAHSVNPFEDCKIGLVLARADDEPRRVRGIAHLYARYMLMMQE